MRIRPYIESRDFESLKEWIDDERAHALWCANLIPYPVTKENLHAFLEKSGAQWADSAYVATEDSGEAVGFFCYSLDLSNNEGFLKCIIVSNKKRGKGYGGEMLRLALQYAFTITGAGSVQLNVFDQNTAAGRCYERAGFTVRRKSENVFSYKDETWSRSNMVVYRRKSRKDLLN